MATTSSAIELVNGDTKPANPASGSVDIYVRNGIAYQLDSSGVETPLVNGVASFNGRTGAVTPLQADYDGFFLTPAEGSAAYDAAGAAAAAQAAAQAASQPLDADLTAIAALTTTAYGRSLLTFASQAVLTAALALATPVLAGAQPAADRAATVNFSTAQVNILDFAADQNTATLTALQNGTTAIGTALAAAVAALPNGGSILFPCGVYNFTAGFTCSTAHIKFLGAARYNTVFLTSSTTADMLTLNQYYITVEGITFTGPGTGQSPTRTAGYAVNVNAANAAYGRVNNCTFTYQFNCVNVGCTLMDVENLELRYFKNDGIDVTQNSDHRITRVTADNNASFLPSGGAVVVTATASLLLDRLNLIHSNNTLDIAPATGVTVPSLKAVNCFFDTGATGVRMASAGSWFRSQFTNCWFSSMTVAGILLAPTTAGNQVDGVTFSSCDIYNNVGGTTNGISVTTGNVGKVKWIGCNVAGWTNGVNFVGGTNFFPIVASCTIGSVSAFGANTTGITIAAGTYKGLILDGNDVVDNTTALSLGAVTVSAAGNYRIIDNAGINPRGTVTTPGVPTAGTTVTNTTGFRVNVFALNGATAPAAIVVNGVSVASHNKVVTTGGNSIQLDPGGTIAFTTTTVTSWVWVAN